MTLTFTKFKKGIALVAVFLMLFTIIPMNANAIQTASDISGHWAEETIQEWIDKDWVKGYLDGSFKPNDYITRAEFVALVNRSFQFTATGPTSFTDVNQNAWYASAVGIAVRAGYIQGYNDNTMKPEKHISREEAATIIMKINNLTANSTATNVFTDAGFLTWSKGAVGAVAAANLMTGYPDGTFGPDRMIRRGETVVLLDRSVKYIDLMDAPAAPLVTRDDVTNTVTGMTSAMEYKLDDGIWTSYVASVFDDLDLSGNHTLLVRYEAIGILPSGLITTLTFTRASTGGGGTYVSVTGVSVMPTELFLVTGESTGTITATVAPSNATNDNVSWASSDEDIATVDDNGIVTPLSAGTTTITVTTDNRGFTATTLVTVNFNQAIATTDLPNTVSLNEAISLMWTSAYGKGTFDASQVTQAYVDVMNTAVSGGAIEAVVVPVELIVPAGKTFSSAQIMHDASENNIIPTTAVKMEPNFGNKLIAWMNTNMAYGWTQPDGEVVYTYVVTWTDTTKTEYAIAFKDADLTAITTIAAISGEAKVGAVLTAGSLTPSEATATYQWSISTTEGGIYTSIAGATDQTYVPVIGDETNYVKVTITGTGSYTGTLTSAAMGPIVLSDAKAITIFDFEALEPTVVGVIDEVAKTITLTVPFGTDVTKLVATFTNSVASTVTVGVVAQISGTTENDFTNQVSYVVTAQDLTTATYAITVTPLLASTLAFADEGPVDKLTTDANFTNIATGAGGGVITYTSGTPATATVNLVTGEVDILAVGTTVITATQAQSATHAAGIDTYTLNVTAPINVVSTNSIANATPANINVALDVEVNGLVMTDFTVTKGGVTYIDFTVTETDAQNYILVMAIAAVSTDVFEVTITKAGYVFTGTTVTNNVAL